MSQTRDEATRRLETLLTNAGATPEEIARAKSQVNLMMTDMTEHTVYEKPFQPHPGQKWPKQVEQLVKIPGFVFGGWKIFCIGNDQSKTTKLVAEWVPEPKDPE
jgi:hypothetical protein